MAELTLSRVGRRAREELESLVDCPTEGISAIDATDDGWTVVVEVLELERVPETTDVLASYEVSIDSSGEVVGYHRVRRYLRAQVEET